MADWSGHRAPRWRYLLLDGYDREQGELKGIAGGTVKLSAATRLGGSAELTIDELDQGIDWLKHRLQIVHDTGMAGKQPWAIATMLFKSPKRTRTGARTSYSVSLLPKTKVLDEAALLQTTSYPAGTPIVETVVDLIRSTGETRIAATPSDAVLASQTVFDAGTPILTVANELLEAAGYWSVKTDGLGQFRIEPYRDPRDRPVAHNFDRVRSILRPTWTHEQDLASIPNRFIAVSQAIGEDPPLVGVAEIDDLSSPYHANNRRTPEDPLWIVATEDEVEASSQTVINQIAYRRLQDRLSPVSTYEVQHDLIPLELNDLVGFSRENVRATVQNMDISLDLSSTVKARWRVVG